MITPEDKNAFIEILGAYYTSKVKPVLIKNSIKDAKGNTHSASMIINVMNGLPFLPIEEAIIEAVEIEKKKAAILKRKKDKLLKSAS
jgi:hypothetical protein